MDVVDSGWLRELATGAADAVGGRSDLTRLNDPTVQAWRPRLDNGQLPVGWWFLPYAPSGNLAVWAEPFHAVAGLDATLRFAARRGHRPVLAAAACRVRAALRPGRRGGGPAGAET